MPGRLLTCLLGVCLLLFTAGTSRADERILHFLSDVKVARNGTLTVSETVTVRAEGNQIRRGIYRDFPLQAMTGNGRVFEVGFKVLAVTQDGSPAPYFVRRNNAGVRIYVGEENVRLKPGTYTYGFVYETDRQIRFFDSHDEVYWNVTGNDWIFPIDEAVARVTLPEGVRANEWIAYTGQYGGRGKAYEARAESEGAEIVFRTTEALPPRAGLTVDVSMPAGSIARPSQAEMLRYFLSDYRTEIIGGGGFLVVLVYYLAAWWLVGRDPASGVTFPRFEPPAGVSPALSRYIVNRGFGDGGWVALSAACLNLAVKKRLNIEERGGVATLSLDPDRPARRDGEPPLPKGEAVLERWLIGRNGPVRLGKSNGLSIKALGEKFRTAIEMENRNVFFRTNRGYLLPGGAISIVTIAALLLAGRIQPGEEGFVVFFLVFSVVATIFAVRLGKAVFRHVALKFRMALVFSVFGLAITVAAAGAFVASGGVDSLPVLPLLAVALAALNILFYFLLGAPTALGREVLDEIEGLKMYLSVAERDRLNMTEAPDMSTQRFETLLPYAVALGVEKPWAAAFEVWLATAAGAALAASYYPDWYSGEGFSASHISDSITQTAHSVSGAFQSSVPIPQSSSSGSFSGFSGGGSSGGGGGGGGGGGW